MKLTDDFFARPCVEVARDLAGKLIVCGEKRLRISEAEAYCGERDTACHASRGRTKRTETLWARPGTIYVYLCYGMHWMLNIVTGREGEPEAVLIRACVEAPGPGRLTKALGVDGSFNKASIGSDTRIAVEDDGRRFAIRCETRVGIGYASPEDQARPWRFVTGEEI